MRAFIQENKIHLIKFGWAVVGGLIVWSFTMGGIYTEHKDMFRDYPIMKSEQQRLVMNDTLMSLKIQQILEAQQMAKREQILTKKVLYNIANKLNVEIPAE